MKYSILLKQTESVRLSVDFFTVKLPDAVFYMNFKWIGTLKVDSDASQFEHGLFKSFNLRGLQWSVYNELKCMVMNSIFSIENTIFNESWLIIYFIVDYKQWLNRLVSSKMWGDKKLRDFEDALSSKGTQRNRFHGP